jgi:translation elongation factor EF-1alpha
LFTEALSGDRIGFSVEDISPRELQRGFVCSDSNNDPAQEASSFIALVNLFLPLVLVNRFIVFLF